MLTELHELLRAVVLERGRIDATEVDITFEPPSKMWIDGLVRPTLDFALIDVQENLNLRNANPQTARTNGSAQIRMPPRRVDLRYLVTALTSDTDDSHRLLWRAMVTLMRTPELPAERLPEEIQQEIHAPLLVRIAQPDAGINVLDAWSAAGAEVRPSFCCVLTVPVELEIVFELPLVLGRAAQYIDKEAPGAPEVFLSIGGVVRDREGQLVADANVAVAGSGKVARTDAEGRYLLNNVRSGVVTLQVGRPDAPSQRKTIDVPSDSYDVRLD
jgi:Pvc16 N-terminal domain/Carboxypeptidase regulatory-like domain